MKTDRISLKILCLIPESKRLGHAGEDKEEWEVFFYEKRDMIGQLEEMDVISEDGKGLFNSKYNSLNTNKMDFANIDVQSNIFIARELLTPIIATEIPRSENMML
ncbi:hypothetical protein NPIL_651271 [Nephila pilipes]|uniref:Uncharacterized protein n=1 Tax=Nephila pilipes TaxID=299642 RepID=A0A8X6TYP9_NEPPI|nr:hypothetical protein NPIL_651271 [Nephila pilipes]